MNPSYNGIGWHKPTLTKAPKNDEIKVTTQKPAPSTPSPRGHA